MIIDSFQWNSTSTGAASVSRGGRLDSADNLTFHIWSGAGTTGTVLFQQAASTKSTEVFGIIGSTAGYALSTGEARSIQFSGPFGAVRPRVTAMTTGVISVKLRAEGSW